MQKKAKFRSDAFKAIHSTAQGLFKAGGIDEAKMRKFDKSCFEAKQYNSNLMASIHETAEDLHEIGLMDKQTMNKFDEIYFSEREQKLSETHKNNSHDLR
jgi:putative transcriptional regulator